MKNTVLVAYASKHGATREIAERIAHVLTLRGNHAAVQRADDVLSLEPYHAVVLGSALYEGDWLLDATDFARRFADQLETLPVWLFSSGVAGEAPLETPIETMRDWKDHPKLLNTLMTHIHPRGSVLFGGRFDPKHLSVGDWWRYPSMRGLRGDFRDWQKIETWAGTIADALADTRSDAVKGLE